MLPVGTIVSLKVPCLNNPLGTKGYVYDNYNIGNHLGVSVIFENGEYDGFSEQEQETFLNKIRKSDLTYNFVNVMRLSADFEKGLFNNVLKGE